MYSTPVFLPAKSQGQRRLVDYSQWDHTKLDMTEQLSVPAHRYRCIQRYRYVYVRPLVCVRCVHITREEGKTGASSLSLPQE